jgi:hypothetical protein
MFASKALPDRFPYRVGAVRLAYEGTLNGARTEHDPRPHDQAMHNKPNPILVEFRRMVDEDWDIRPGELGYYAEAWVDLFKEDPHMESPANWGSLALTSKPAADHARAVLDRVARMYEVDL